MKNVKLSPVKVPFELSQFEIHSLDMESQALKGNPLGDPTRRQNYVLVPIEGKARYPLVVHLPGYFSTGYQNFSVKTLNQNFPQKLDELTSTKKISKAVHLFVDASTYWGGSQFINSPGCGRYEDYILKELIPGAQSLLPIDTDPQRNLVMGGSSGGYGALSLIRHKKSPFGVAYAVAPDSYFEASLLSELFHASPELLKYPKFSQLKKKIAQGEIQDKKSFFGLVNAVAMAHCYSPKEAIKKDGLVWPIDLKTGVIDQSLWKKWLKHDPVRFLKKDIHNLKNKKVHLEVGMYDNFSLQFGSRQIAELLKKNKIKGSYSEFPGNHFGLSARRLDFLTKGI